MILGGVLTQKYLKEALTYNPETGEFTWKKRPLEHFKTAHSYKMWNTLYSGKSAGFLNNLGYKAVKLSNRYYLQHQLAWLFMTGELPKEIDHEDHDRANNKWSNLREVSHKVNGRNQSMWSTNKSGFNGVCFNKVKQKWDAYIWLNNASKSLGSFADKKDAITARKAANIKHDYHPSHGLQAVGG